MWDPFFAYVRRERAVLPGYHRAFVMAFSRVWGSEDAPCVVLGLERGGSCVGIAYEVLENQVAEIKEELSAFEGAAFEVTRKSVRLTEGEVEALVALNRPSHADYLGHLSMEERAGMVRRAQGSKDSCLAYLRHTAASLKRLGMRDEGVERFVRLVERASG